MSRKEHRLTLDKVEKKFLTEIKAKNPEYKDLELSDIAHIELRERLFSNIREIIKALCEFLSHVFTTF